MYYLLSASRSFSIFYNDISSDTPIKSNGTYFETVFNLLQDFADQPLYSDLTLELDCMSSKLKTRRIPGAMSINEFDTHFEMLDNIGKAALKFFQRLRVLRAVETSETERALIQFICLRF